ncbi:MAG TPA: bifunctional phosphoribosylaminoimidazolecarboxamide formyltransferase/IMP cyclohydrolase [Steroidobacteraceae bacterium]|jgi:phosphoribosylaminoimidazolecarboxamide formyltransferase/IMP cyclohydrolase|nr:bifunctional phosphoribosylaminoimidazolecarboxamide formyltransferase/IMP cyclohydrolase [Steroidobacteraceae bacterium]
MSTIRRALLSVSDKRGLASFAARLHERGVQLLSTGGTAELLQSAGLPVRQVADYTGFPELMNGRLKTLHPRVHGGLLARRGIDEPQMQQHGIEPIDLLAVNLYPFAATVSRADVSFSEAIEQIDVGGPAMLRAAAKNHADVTVLVDPDDYTSVLEEIEASGETSIDTRARLAAKAFAHTAQYDARIAAWLHERSTDEATLFPETLALSFDRQYELRYGENPHQRAALYRQPLARGASVAAARLMQGKELSYNNLTDAEAAIECVRQLERPGCVIVKHANPCGAAVAADAHGAYRAALRTDPTSAFGGIIAFNRPLDAACAQALLEQRFVEVIAAPSVAPEAQAALAAKPQIRVLALGDLNTETHDDIELRSVGGGLLLQQRDRLRLDPADLRIVTRRAPDSRELEDLLFGWQIVQFAKSNAIVLAREGATLGIGAGQTSRVYATRIAVMKANEQQLPLRGAVLASDAYFPFRDGIDAAATQGVTAIIQPGGSRRDDECIAAADEHGVAMVFTGVRHFRH